MPAAFALALLSVDGLGRTTAHRLLERFPTYEALRATPREQVLLRIKGAPHADRTVDTVLGDAFEPDALAPARATVGGLRERGIRTLAPGDPDWPTGLNDLDRADRPVVLYTYGNPDALSRSALACLGRPPIDAAVFETSQAVARQALSQGAGLVVGTQSGFDVALQKLSVGADRGAVAVLNCGLAKLEPSLRPAATALTRGGGLLVSPFPMNHGPFDHDDRERALVQAALGQAVAVAVAPEGSPEQRAAAWAAETRRKVAFLTGKDAPEALWGRLWGSAR